MTATITYSKPFNLSSASGWKIDQTMQYEFGGLLFGAGTPFIVTKVKGLLGGSASGESQRNVSGDGAISGIITNDPKMIEFTIETDVSRVESQPLIDALEDAFQIPERWLNVFASDDAVRGAPLSSRLCLAYMRDGWTEPRIVFCRSVNLDIDSSYETTTGRITANIRLQADNPMKFSMATTKVSMHLHKADLVGEFRWENLGNHVNGYPMYVQVRCPGPNGYKNFGFYRKWENPFDPSGFSYDRLTTAFSWNKSFDVDFKQRLTKPVGPLATMSPVGWFRVKPGEQWIGVQRAAWAKNGPMDVHFFIRHQWR